MYEVFAGAGDIVLWDLDTVDLGRVLLLPDGFPETLGQIIFFSDASNR